MKGLSRRRLLSSCAAGAAGTGVALLTGCGDEGTGPSIDDQVEALNDVLTLERGVVATYESAREHLSGSALAMAETFFGQEREHVDALEAAIEELGGTLTDREPQDTYREELGLPELDGRDDFLALAVDLENTAIGLYGTAVATVTSPEIRRKLFTVNAAEAQHLSVVLGELGEPQVPDAFVFGTQVEGR